MARAGESITFLLNGLVQYQIQKCIFTCTCLSWLSGIVSGFKEVLWVYNHQQVLQGIEYRIPSQVYRHSAWVMNMLTEMNKEKKKQKWKAINI